MREVDCTHHAGIPDSRDERSYDSAGRNNVARNIARSVNGIIPKSGYACDSGLVNELAQSGYVMLPSGLTGAQIEEIVAYFSSIPVYNAHQPRVSDGVRRFLQHNARNHPFGSFTLEDVVKCPHLLEVALNPSVLAVAANYLGCTPTLYSLHAWWSFPGHPPAGPQDYHRDIDDFRFCAMFIYLTDVNGGASGAEHRYIKCTHDEGLLAKNLPNAHGARQFFPPDIVQDGYGSAGAYESVFSHLIDKLTGKAGTTFLADTFGLHKGVPPTGSDRLVFWARYGLRRNMAYRIDETVPVSSSLVSDRILFDDRVSYILRLLVDDAGQRQRYYTVSIPETICSVERVRDDWEVLQLNTNDLIDSLHATGQEKAGCEERVRSSIWELPGVANVARVVLKWKIGRWFYARLTRRQWPRRVQKGKNTSIQ